MATTERAEGPLRTAACVLDHRRPARDGGDPSPPRHLPRQLSARRLTGPTVPAVAAVDRSAAAPAASAGAPGGTPMTSLRWALAFYAAFAFLPLGTAVALWLGP